MFQRRRQPEPVRFRDLIRGDFSQARRQYQIFRRKCYLFVFLPAAVFAILHRAAEEYARIRAVQEQHTHRP